MPDPSSPSDAVPPGGSGALRSGVRVMGRYELLRELGRGGMGVVWLALDHTLQRQVAFKVLPDVLRQDRTALVDLRDETRRNLEITHPHIVRIYDFEEDETVAGITMEFVDGETLAAKKSNRPQRTFDALELVPWLRQLCEALHYAHTDPRVVHRDLKPANLMVNTRGQLKVTDFGIARSISDSFSRVSNEQATSGTLVYMSPQQLMGSSAPSDDIYSLGATLYDLLTGKPPFHTGNVSAQVLQAKAPPMAERRTQLGRQGEPIPAVFEEVVAACLSKNPEDRPPTALAVIERIEAGLAMNRHPVPVAPPETGTHPAPPPQVQLAPPIPPPLPIEATPSRGPWMIVAIFLIAGLLALGGGIYVGTRDDAAHPEPTPPPGPPRPGRVMVNTIPSGARVQLDGRDSGTSPSTIDEVAPGDHRLHVEAADYEPFDMHLAVGSGETVNSGIISLIATKHPEPPPPVTPPATTPDPRPSPPPPPVGISVEAVRDVIRNYLNATNAGDIDGIVACYASGVDFFDEGTLSTAQLRRSQVNFRSHWPLLTITSLSDINVFATGDPNVKVAKYEYHFIARNGQKHSSGTAHDTATLKQIGDRVLIVHTRQTVTNREKNFR